jgi:hypothetical protein
VPRQSNGREYYSARRSAHVPLSAFCDSKMGRGTGRGAPISYFAFNPSLKPTPEFPCPHSSFFSHWSFVTRHWSHRPYPSHPQLKPALLLRCSNPPPQRSASRQPRPQARCGRRFRTFVIRHSFVICPSSFVIPSMPRQRMAGDRILPDARRISPSPRFAIAKWGEMT